MINTLASEKTDMVKVKGKAIPVISCGGSWGC
jgi:hypothetical protein